MVSLSTKGDFVCLLLYNCFRHKMFLCLFISFFIPVYLMETLQEFSSSSPTFFHPKHTLAHKCYKFLQCKSLMTDVNIVYSSDQKLQSSLVSNLKHTRTHAHTPPLSNTPESSSLSPVLHERLSTDRTSRSNTPGFALPLFRQHDLNR